MVLAATSSLAVAQSPAPSATPSSPPTAADSALRVTLLTMGQGDQVWELFGHNAIWIHDPATSSDIVYNWGVFDFRAPGFLPRFLLGDMRYMMVGETIGNTLANYRYLNRHVWAQELDLTAAEKRALVDFVRWNAQPENAQYRYNYYLDNCSTRVRDAIDRVLGGRLRTHLQAIPTSETYRSHSLRLMQKDKAIVTGVDMALGRPTDLTLTADEASFLPGQLMAYMRGFKRDDGRPIVAREYLIGDATRDAEPDDVPALWKGLLPLGLALAALVLGGFFGTRARRTTATLVAIIAGVAGLIGTVLLLLVTITDHVAAHRNENILMLNPLWLVAAVAVPMLLVRGKAQRVARWTVILGAALGLCAVAIHLVGVSRQPNWNIIALVLPAQLAIATIVIVSIRRRSGPDGSPG